MILNYKSLDGHWLWSEVSNQRNELGKAAYTNVLVNILQIFTSLYVMAVYNKVIPNQAISSLVTLALGISIAIVFDYAFKLIKSRIINISCENIEEVLQPKLFKKVLSWDLQKRPKFAGSASTLLRDLESIIELFTNSSITTIINLPFVLVNLLVIYFIAGPLVFVTGSVCLLTGVSSIYFFLKVKKNSEDAKSTTIEKNSVFLEALSNLETLKSIANYNYFEKKWHKVDQENRRINSILKISVSDSNSLNTFFVSMGQVGIVSYGAYLVVYGEISSGGLIAAVILNGRTVQPLIQMTGLLQKFSIARTGYYRLNQLFGSESDEEKRRQNIRIPKISGEISVDNLSFLPEGVTYPIFEAPRLRINDGESVGIVGSVGSGKSTFLKLLAGVLTPTSGSVCYGSFDTGAINQNDLRNNVSYLGQSPGIFGGTIRENIIFDRDDIEEQKIIDAMSLTGLATILKRFPNGLSFNLSENGRELSGGQKQILALTRCMVSNPKVILLDEPTSAMDPRHENLFIKQMESYTRDKTFIVVTHRRPILALTNRIIVIEQGKIILDGQRDEVLKKFK